MRSAPAEDPATTAPPDDRTAQARIRDAAITCFAAHGVDATSVRTIARQAGVSPALVMHHYGSKDNLRVACDEHVAAVIRQNKHDAMAAGPGFDPLATVRNADSMAPLLQYLARTLADGTPEVAALFDELVDDAVEYMQEGVDSGILRSSDHPRGRAAVLVAWTLGALVLHEHVERLLGVDLTADPREAFATPDYIGPVLEIFANGVLTDEAAHQMRRTFPGGTPPTTTDEETGRG